MRQIEMRHEGYRNETRNFGMGQEDYRSETNLEGTDDSFLVHPLHVICVVVLGKFLKRSEPVPRNLRGEE